MNELNQDQKWLQSFLDELEPLLEKHADRIPDVIMALQSTVISLVCDIEPSAEEAAEILHEMIDDCIDDMISLEEDSEATLIEE